MKSTEGKDIDLLRKQSISLPRTRVFIFMFTLVLLAAAEIVVALLSLTQNASASASTWSLQGPKSGAPGAPASPECGPLWATVPSANVDLSSNNDEFLGVAAVSSNDVWAVGESYGSSQAQIEHWNGTVWNISFASPGGGRLNAVAAVSSNDVWAVGYSDGTYIRTVIEHWNGTAWSLVPSPNPGTADELQGVAAVSSTDVWAVGRYGSDLYVTQPLMEHWDGTQWHVAVGPAEGASAALNSVSAKASYDVWAVGEYQDTSPGSYHTLTEHWSGTGWEVVSSPNPGPGSNSFTGVTMISSNDVWAVGSYDPGYYGTVTLTEHWNGAQWSPISSPNPGPELNSLSGVAAISTNNVRAVGTYEVNNTYHTLTEYWNGTQWYVVSSPNSGTGDDSLNAVAAVSGSDVWAVGAHFDPQTQERPIIEHWNGTHWSIVTSPLSTMVDNSISGLDAVSSNDVWAVGSYDYASVSQTLIEHWDGTQWSVVSSPNVGTSDNYLNAVTAISSNDVWAVGYYRRSDNGVTQTLTEHWDGTQWSEVPSYSVNVGTDNNYFTGVSAVSTNDVWVVGYYHHGSVDQTLTEHWSGTSWNPVSSLNVGTSNNQLSGVSAVSSNDVWAVGYYHTGVEDLTLIQHWNGSNWSLVPGANPSAYVNRLNGIEVVSSSDIWAVGDGNGTLTEHWDGTQWTAVDSPNVGTSVNNLHAVSATSSNDVWAVGDYNSDTDTQDSLILHWDGSTWSVVSSPSPGPNQSYLNGVAAISSSDVWAAGYYFDGNFDRTLTERYNLCQPTPTDSPTPIPSVTPIATDTAIADTPSATPTTMQFRDVPRNSPFYTYIECLVGRGIISGYPDGTFKPNNPITRGQLSKIVSNSAGYSEQHTTRTFQDVPTNSTFYQFIERLSSRGYLAGYTCGGAGEPCGPPANLPYFRPNADVTRGQTSKIVASAKGLPAPPSGEQTFQDVPANSTFWRWIEALATTGAIQGYACGGNGEQCVPPANLPYFRPGANVTRGQSTKIVGNTFFPDCSSQ